ncbi:hypothetical protein AVEN_122524-1 [Araneus ventricosus]|uniref:Uncharacterized protein n=1 Tax=Araneus ventricosus TaxID=182803 RepID=A0A4Y2JX61_ARAVE|nr:hypothetical protein AVEN_122524-1 [Araneus ventricosus]
MLWRPQSTPRTVVKQDVVDRNPGSSKRAPTAARESSRRILWLLLQRQSLHPFNLQRAQLLQSYEHQWSVDFEHWFPQKSSDDLQFPGSVLLSYEPYCENIGVYIKIPK